VQFLDHEARDDLLLALGLEGGFLREELRLADQCARRREIRVNWAV
jgi:hypothetical protein